MSFEHGLTKEQIRERLRVQQRWITDSRTDIFASAVGEKVTRYIVNVRLFGDNTSNRIAKFEKKEEDGTYTMKYSYIHIGQTTNVKLQDNSDFEKPILILHGGSNLTGSILVGASVAATVEYWDDTIR